MKRALIVLAVVLLVLAVGGGVAGYFFWDDIGPMLGMAPSVPPPVNAEESQAEDDLVMEDETGGAAADPAAVPADGAVDAGGDEMMDEGAEPAADVAAEPGAEADAGLDEDLGGDEGGEDMDAEPAAAPEPAKPAAKPAAPVATPKPAKVAPKPAAKPAEAAAPARSSGGAIMKKVQALVNRGKWADAVAVLDPYLKDNPDDGDAHFQLGFAYMQLKQPAKARPHLEQASRKARDATTREYAARYLKNLK